ncbi:hypothetical protein EV360DRAFT_90423 [Lentinula raphanica]|nr:hypothetical protein EV360DRAFT_90423 [Lentinula raphanica]
MYSVWSSGLNRILRSKFLDLEDMATNHNIWVTGLVSLFVMAEFAEGTVLCKAYGVIVLVRVRTFIELAAELKALSVTVNALAAAGDVLIAATLAWVLQQSKTGSQKSSSFTSFYGFDSILTAKTRLDKILNKLTIFVINTGMLTSLFALGSLISILAAPNTFIYMSFFFCMGRLYTNAILASLNARKKMRGEGDHVQTTNCKFLFQNEHLTKRSSFMSFASKKHRGHISNQNSTILEHQAQDYSKTFWSRPEEVYDLGTTCMCNLPQMHLESTADTPTFPSEAHCHAV